jgi:hypothetical protein
MHNLNLAEGGRVELQCLISIPRFSRPVASHSSGTFGLNLVGEQGLEPHLPVPKTGARTLTRYSEDWWTAGESNPDLCDASATCSRCHQPPIVKLVAELGVEPRTGAYETPEIPFLYPAMKLEPNLGLEPRPHGLRNRCSTLELVWHALRGGWGIRTARRSGHVAAWVRARPDFYAYTRVAISRNNRRANS